jgi:hypothetical protein
VLDAFYPLGPGVTLAGALPDGNWRTRITNASPGFTAAQIGVTTSMGWDATLGVRYVIFPAAGAGTVYAVTDETVAQTPPLVPTGSSEMERAQFFSWRGTFRWAAGNYTNFNNGTIIGWCWQPAAGSVFPDPENVYRFFGIVRGPSGIYVGYRNNGPAATLIPIPNYSFTTWTTLEFRFRSATASEYGRAEILINGVAIWQETWANAEMPTPLAATNLFFCPIIMRYGTPAIPALHWRNAEIIIGPDVESTY